MRRSTSSVGVETLRGLHEKERMDGCMQATIQATAGEICFRYSISPLSAMASPGVRHAQDQRPRDRNSNDVLEGASPTEMVVAGRLMSDQGVGESQEVDEQD